MGLNDYRPCPCGSGKESWWEFDINGIPLCRVCKQCRERKMATYDPAILPRD